MDATPMGPHERLAACNGAANEAIERADQCRAEGSSVGMREWMQAAAAALAAAGLAREALGAIERGEAKEANE